MSQKIIERWAYAYRQAQTGHRLSANRRLCAVIEELSKSEADNKALLDAAKDISQLLGGWREAIVELEDWCSEPVRLKNMLAAADQIDDLAPKLRAAIEHSEPQ